MEKQEILCRVRGKVQGVTYRDFTAKHARHLALVGYVRNRPDFTVEVLAQGFPDKLEKLIEYLHKGPFGSRISAVDVEWREIKKEYSDFSIVY